MRSPEELKAESQELLSFIAIYLRAERTRAGLTQEDMAARTAMSRAWVSKTEAGNNNALPSLALYAAALGLQLAYIVAQAESALATVDRSMSRAAK